MDSKKFSIILIIVFIIGAIFAVLLFSGAIKIGKSASNTAPSGSVTMWGTLPSSSVSDILDKLNMSTKTISVTYIQKDPSVFSSELTKATLGGFAPDLILAPDDTIFAISSFIKETSYTSYPESLFRQSFMEASETFLTKEGIISLPVSTDPFVLFYNRDILSVAGFSQPPQIWDELFLMNDLITLKDISGTITRSLIPFGQFDNVFHAKDILTTLILQSGNKIVDISGISKVSTLNDVESVSKVVTFFTSFSDPISNAYSWNRALPEARDMFLVGKLAFYPGFASEIYALREKNPNLNFAPSQFPQIRGTERPVTLSHVLGVSMLKSSQNPNAAYAVMILLSGSEFSGVISDTLGLPSARRDTLNQATTSSYGNLFLRSSLISRNWFDPNKDMTNIIFKNMITNINRGKSSVDQGVSEAHNELNTLLSQ